MKLKAYKTIFKTYFSQELQSKVDVLGYLIVIAIYLLSSLLFWSAVYKDNSVIAGYTQQDMILYYTLVGIIAYSMSMNTTDTISFKIKYGNLSQELIKPYKIIKIEFLSVLANRLFNLAVFLIFFIAILLFLVVNNSISISLVGIIYALPILALGFVIKYLLLFFIGLMAFWLNEVWFLNHIRRIIINFFSGIYVPVILFPQWLQSTLKYLPFKFLLPLP